MPTAIYFIAGKESGLASVVVTEEADDVDRIWAGARTERDGLMRVTQRRTGRTIRVNPDAVAYWGERR